LTSLEQGNSTKPASKIGLNPVAWTYIMSGGFTLVVGGIILFFSFLNIENKIHTEHSKTAEKRPEEPIRDVVSLLVPVFMYFFMCASIEGVYQSFVYSIAVCSDLHFSVSCCFSQICYM